MENNSNSGVIYQGKIPNRVKYCFAFGALGKDLIYGMIATFSMIYFTDIIKVAPHLSEVCSSLQSCGMLLTIYLWV